MYICECVYVCDISLVRQINDVGREYHGRMSQASVLLAALPIRGAQTHVRRQEAFYQTYVCVSSHNNIKYLWLYNIHSALLFLP